MASRLEYLNQIGIALSQERDINKLLETILIAAKNLTHADAGTLYRLVDGKLAPPAKPATVLRSRVYSTRAATSSPALL